MHGRCVDRLKHDLCHLLSVGLEVDGVVWSGRRDVPRGQPAVRCRRCGVLLAYADHDYFVAGTAHRGGEDGPGGVVYG